ncbi:hypothetical protein [Aureliella helgolandensis]|uniref:Uncharacterized protein n=1 Tax=Aureliella helgolandensis TaxID=2527968 RepID=A0A518GCL4_9BACT|nr:hypothetical protein [Aureliella helgolandensis]QDV26342.1 hypothetical protein Q31a_47150 [Aureliella helgolandensis]
MTEPSNLPKPGTLSRAEKKQRHFERLQRLPRVVKSYLQGLSILEIAEKEGVRRSLIDKDMRYARGIWRKRVEESAEEYLDRELEKLNLIETEAWAAWERSKLSTLETMREKGEDGKVKRRRVVRQNYGDPRFLDQARKIVDDRCKMLKIGQYSTEESNVIHARTVEVVVETVEQVNRIMNYEQYEELLGPSDN